jgi:hypothetical protein
LEQKLLWKSPWNCWNFRISLNQDLANGMGYPVWSGGAGPLSGVENVPTLRESCDARLLFGSICWRNVWMQPRKQMKLVNVWWICARQPLWHWRVLCQAAHSQSFGG